MEKTEEIIKEIETFLDFFVGTGLKSINLKARFEEDLEMDLLDKAEIVINAERNYDIHISKEEIRALVTVGDLVTLIEKHLASK